MSDAMRWLCRGDDRGLTPLQIPTGFGEGGPLPRETAGTTARAVEAVDASTAEGLAACDAARDHPAAVVREAAVYALGRIAQRDDVRRRLSAIASDDPSPGVRAAALDALEDDWQGTLPGDEDGK